MMTNEDKLFEAAQTLKDYCTRTLCPDCPFYDDVCRLKYRAPCHWNVLDELRKQTDTLNKEE